MLELDAPEHRRVSVDVPHPAMLIITDHFYPGWVALLDGKQVPLIRANNIHQAVEISTGKHVLRAKLSTDLIVIRILYCLPERVSGLAILCLLAPKRAIKP